MDSNPRSPVRRTTLFRDSSFPTCARATAAFKNARAPAQLLLLPVVDPVRMNAELTRQPGDPSGPPRPPPPPPLRFNHRVVLLPCLLHLLLLRCRAFYGQGSTLANRLIFGAQFRPWELLLAFDDQQGDGLRCAQPGWPRQ